MNLAKKGTVLMTALSVFTLASCNKNSDNSISYDKAKEWVEEHYSGEDRTDIKHYKKSWDYSKNDGGDRKTPDTWPADSSKGYDFKSKNVDDMSAISLNTLFEIPATEKINEKTGSYSGCTDPEPFREGAFKKNLGSKDRFDNVWLDRPNAKFYIEDNKLKVVDTYAKGDEGFPIPEGFIYLYFVETDTVYYDEKGYEYKCVSTFTSDHFAVGFEKHEKNSQEIVDLGIANLEVTTEPLTE